MKTIWCYIFYFTWQIFIKIDKFIFDKPMNYLYRLFPNVHKYRVTVEDGYNNVMNNPKIGFNILLSYRWMLLTTAVIVANIEITIFYLSDTSLIEIINPILGMKLSKKINVIAFFVSSLFLSYWINESLLQWGKSGYISYFNFAEKHNRKIGFLSTFIFHVGSAFICVFLVLFFNM